MAASGNTPHYSLSQFGPNDRPSWIDDYNADMQTLDTAVSGAQSDAAEAKQSATVNSQEIQQVSQQMGDMTNEITDIKNRLGASDTVYNYFTWNGVYILNIQPPDGDYINIGNTSQGGLGDNDIINLVEERYIQVNQDGIYCIWSSVNIGRFSPQLNVPMALSLNTSTETESITVHGSAATPLASDTDGTYTQIEQSLTLPPTVMSLRAGTYISIFIDPRGSAGTERAIHGYELESATGIVKIR